MKFIHFIYLKSEISIPVLAKAGETDAECDTDDLLIDMGDLVFGEFDSCDVKDLMELVAKLFVRGGRC